jgi:Sugar phosphate isomerases/epimerases
MKVQIVKTDKRKNLWLIVLTAIILLTFSDITIFAQYVNKEKIQPHVKLSLNAYSFNDVLSGKGQKNNKPNSTLLELLDWCALQNIDAIDVTGYYFPGYPEVPTDKYIYELKRKAFKLGIDISGTGIKNNFAFPDPAARAADVKRAKEWILVAEKLGAPVIRLFAGEIPKGYENKWDEVAEWMIECFKECAAFGEQHGVIIGIQNHGDMLQTAEQCIKVIKAINSKWVGMVLDTGSFKVKDPYVDIEAVIPYAVNWQVKESVFGTGSDVKIDILRLMKILKRSNYRGYIPVETLVLRDRPYDPYTLIPAFMKDLKIAMNAKFK